MFQLIFYMFINLRKRERKRTERVKVTCSLSQTLVIRVALYYLLCQQIGIPTWGGIRVRERLILPAAFWQTPKRRRRIVDDDDDYDDARAGRQTTAMLYHSLCLSVHILFVHSLCVSHSLRTK